MEPQQIAAVSKSLSQDDSLLTLKDVAERTGWALERLRMYINKDLNAYVQARPKKGSKGVGYPESSLPFFEKLLADALAKKVVPTTVAGWLEELTQDVPAGNVPNTLLQIEAANVSTALSQNQQTELLQAILNALTRPVQPPALPAANLSPSDVNAFTQALERHSTALERLPLPDDTLLTAAQVHAAYIPRAADWLRDHVPSVKVGRNRYWRKTTVLAWIAAQKET